MNLVIPATRYTRRIELWAFRSTRTAGVMITGDGVFFTVVATPRSLGLYKTEPDYAFDFLRTW